MNIVYGLWLEGSKETVMSVKNKYLVGIIVEESLKHLPLPKLLHKAQKYYARTRNLFSSHASNCI